MTIAGDRPFHRILRVSRPRLLDRDNRPQRVVNDGAATGFRPDGHTLGSRRFHERVSCLSSNPAHAAGTDENCAALSKIKAQLTDGAPLTALTPGQWNFLRGFYLGAPPTLQGKIPGTGAALIERKGSKGGMIVWTRGLLACSAFPVPQALVDAIKRSKTGPLGEDGTELLTAFLAHSAGAVLHLASALPSSQKGPST